MATLLDSGIRGEVLAADPALGSVQVLVDAGWACIGIRPFMRLWAQPDDAGAAAATAPEAVPHSEVSCLTEPADLKVAGQIVADAFGRDPDPVMGSTQAGYHNTSERLVWGLYEAGEMVSCATTVRVEDTVVLWDVATRPGSQRGGYGKRLLDAVHARCVDSWNTRQFLLSSSDAGYRLYESLGYETLAWWQSWSRPRWAFPAS
ncbi:MAG TPA: GNAT family N-acetyltransferase [Jatrophihabitantaceae bacterium]